MKKLSEKNMTQTIGGDYCSDVATIFDGAVASGNFELALTAAYYYAVHCGG